MKYKYFVIYVADEGFCKHHVETSYVTEKPIQSLEDIKLMKEGFKNTYANDYAKIHLLSFQLLSQEEEKNENSCLWDLKYNQEFTSAKTSINSKQLPATFGKLEKMGVLKEDILIADIGGGRYDNAIIWASFRDIYLHIFDPFNRNEEYNLKAISRIAHGQSDIVTVNNVLNVIKEQENRIRVIQQAYDALKNNCTAYFSVHEGNKSGIGSGRNETWQNNQKLIFYLDEVFDVFEFAKIKYNMIIAEKNEIRKCQRCKAVLRENLKSCYKCDWLNK